MYKKIAVSALAIALLSLNVQAVEINNTVSSGTTTMTGVINSLTTGNVNSETLKYSTSRSSTSDGKVSGGNSACGSTAGCGVVSQDQVTVNLSASKVNTDLNERTSGKVSGTNTFCNNSVSSGILSSGNTASSGSQTVDATTNRNNVTTTTGRDITVSTTTNGQYSTGKGDDVVISVGGKDLMVGDKKTTSDIGSRNVAMGTAVDDVLYGEVVVKGTGGGVGATSEGVVTTVTATNLKTIDTGSVTQHTETKSNSVGSFIN